MNIPYRTRRVLNRLGTVALILLLIFIVAWLCWVVWLQRYVVYTDDGASIDFELSANEISGEVAVEPKAESYITIYYNEGANAINVSHEMEQLNGYYIDSTMLQQDMEGVLSRVDKLDTGTAIMVDMKGPYGSFFYPSALGDAVHSASTDVNAVKDLITKLQQKGFYTIARVSAFRDREYGNNHVSSGLYMLNRKGLWMDSGGMYWLDPTNASTTGWISSVVLELRDLGFDEVMLYNLCFPDSDQYIFNGDKAAALQAAASTLMSSCGASNFVLSFCVDDPAFTLPEGRTRLYLEGIGASAIGQTAAKATMEDKQIGLVFIADTADTRYNDYSVLRSLYISDVVSSMNGG